MRGRRQGLLKAEIMGNVALAEAFASHVGSNNLAQSFGTTFVRRLKTATVHMRDKKACITLIALRYKRF